MQVTIEFDKNKLTSFLEAKLFHEDVFDAQTRVKIVQETSFGKEDSTLLALLAEDEAETIREIVASNENTPPETLDELSFDDSAKVRKALALNPNISEELLEDLADDEDLEVREAVMGISSEE